MGEGIEPCSGLRTMFNRGAFRTTLKYMIITQYHYIQIGIWVIEPRTSWYAQLFDKINGQIILKAVETVKVPIEGGFLWNLEAFGSLMHHLVKTLLSWSFPLSSPQAEDKLELHHELSQKTTPCQ